MITREKLENNQVWLYVIVLVIAAGFGLIVPDFAGQLDVTISAVIAILMYSMFSQIPFTSLKESFANRRFIWALLTVNYISSTYCGMASIKVITRISTVIAWGLFSFTYPLY